MSRVVGLLRTEDPVVLRLTEQPAATLRVADAPVRLVVTPEPSTLLATDRQGPPGPQGEPGEDAGFGQLRVADMHVDPEDYFTAGQRQQLIFTPDPAQTQNFLRDPFTSVAWTGNRIVPRANGYGDWQDIVVNLLVMPAFAGGSIIADLDVGTGSTSTPVQTAYYGLRGSGTPERATFRLGLQTLDGFQANGARIFLTGTVPFIVQSESIVYLPINIGPGHP